MKTSRDQESNGDQQSGEHTLRVLASCEGCGVCCFHMGFPVYLLPRRPMSDAEIESDPKLRKQIALDPLRREELLAGHPGESYWHAMPVELKAQWEAHVAKYSTPKYGVDPSTFDGPCIWLDMETRQCKNHEYRPRICREFETGSRECLEWRNYYSDKVSLNLPDEN